MSKGKVKVGDIFLNSFLTLIFQFLRSLREKKFNVFFKKKVSWYLSPA